MTAPSGPLSKIPPDVVFTTCPVSANKKGRPWIRFLPSRELLKSRYYAFTDGSTLGGYAVVLMAPSQVAGHTMAGASDWTKPTKTGNVGAEWRGLLLGLRELPSGCHATIVTDYLWSIAQLIGVRQAKEPETQAQLAEALALIATKNWKTLMLIHHRGHQKNDVDGEDSHFTELNREADRLCGERNKAAKEVGLA